MLYGKEVLCTVAKWCLYLLVDDIGDVDQFLQTLQFVTVGAFSFVVVHCDYLARNRISREDSAIAETDSRGIVCSSGGGLLFLQLLPTEVYGVVELVVFEL